MGECTNGGLSDREREREREMPSLRAENEGALGILLLHVMSVSYQDALPKEITIYIDNSEVARRGQEKAAKLGITK